MATAGDPGQQAPILGIVEHEAFEEQDLFRAIASSGARALLIGRRALIALGVPLLTSDYDLWIDADDASRLNDALEPLELFPSCSPEEARSRGRYVLENDERIDVLVAKRVTTVDGVRVAFDDVWQRRREIDVGGVPVALPCIDDLIATKKFAARARDLDDIALLEALRREHGDA